MSENQYLTRQLQIAPESKYILTSRRSSCSVIKHSLVRSFHRIEHFLCGDSSRIQYALQSGGKSKRKKKQNSSSPCTFIAWYSAMHYQINSDSMVALLVDL